MYKLNVLKKFSHYLLLIFLLVNAPILHAQKIVASGVSSAGFRFATDDAVSEPVIHYQQNIQMLSGIDDRPSLKVFGSGRVVAHYPAYMKKAGDYEMQMDEVELTTLIRSLSSDGVMDFDEAKVKENVRSYKADHLKKGELHTISDAVETVVDIKLDEFQKNNKAAKIKKFHKEFKWKNIEQDAARYKHDKAITGANRSITSLKELMKDARMVKRNK